jgi:hypothetical protein
MIRFCDHKLTGAPPLMSYVVRPREEPESAAGRHRDV